MSTQREGFNPLRPYYIAPTIGEPADAAPTSNARPFAATNATAHAGYASRARDVFADIDYKDYIGDSSPSVGQKIKELVDELVWKYASVLMAQPFEVAKTILQARDQGDPAIASPLQTRASRSSRHFSEEGVSVSAGCLARTS